MVLRRPRPGCGTPVRARCSCSSLPTCPSSSPGRRRSRGTSHLRTSAPPHAHDAPPPAPRSPRGTPLSVTRIRRGGRRFGRHQRRPTLRTCSVRFRDARSRVNDAPSVVQLRRCQRSFLGNIRERFHRRDDPVLTSRSDSSRRGGTRTRGSGSTRSTAVPSTPPTGVKPARNRAAAMGARALVWKGTHAPNFIARAINKSGERRVRRRGADQRLSPAHC